ncbi:MAG TPA: hypothetical protein VFH73_17695 [Polyangia bacterium]|nr:hypothetical protein [Polyangia bacterium]
MDAHKLQLKIFAEPAAGAELTLEPFIGIFHRWIKQRLLPELVIDVANYAHVPDGPGVVLIGHGSDYFIDRLDGRLGLLSSRKRAGLAPADRLTDLARRTFHAAALLEREPSLTGKLRFRPGELLFRLNDRLAAANTDAAFAALKPEIEALAKLLYAGPFEITRVGGRKDLLSLRITSNAAVSLATLLERAGGPPAADASLVA